MATIKSKTRLHNALPVLPVLLALLVVAVACGSDDGAPASSGGEDDGARFIIQSATIFSSLDLKELGWKEQKDFVLEYPESIEAKWGFLDAKELGILVYPSAEIAQVAGKKAAAEQTAVDADGKATGVIDRISCRDAQGQSAVKALPGGTMELSPGAIHVTYQPEASESSLEPRVCSNKFPTYTEYRILGNMVLLCEGEGRTGDSPSKNCRDLPGILAGG